MDLPLLKDRFGFRVSVPSFIHPAGYVENVRLLGGHVDEIELLFLESHPAALPSPALIAELVDLAERLRITYNVHLPTDVDPVADDRSARLAAVHRIATVRSLAAPLDPTTFTLHLPFNDRPASLSAWQDRALQSLELLIRPEVDPRSLSIETLEYPHAWLAPILEAQPYSVCLDVGHLANTGRDLKSALEDLAPRISILHVHGAAGGTDHLGLDRLAPAAWATLHPFLTGFGGSVSLEVFSAARLKASMTFLHRQMALREPAGLRSSLA